MEPETTIRKPVRNRRTLDHRPYRDTEEWTKRCITDIRHFQAKHQIHTISYLQYQLFMEYAVSLRKHGKNKEALSVLEELDRVSFNNVATPLLRNKDNIEEYKVRVARMLSECHYATGNQSEAIQQANRADSLQSIPPLRRSFPYGLML